MAWWWGECQRCKRRRDLGLIPGTRWKVCVECYVEWFELPADHPAKGGRHAEASSSVEAPTGTPAA